MIGELIEISQLDEGQADRYNLAISFLKIEDISAVYFVPNFSDTETEDLFVTHNIRGWMIESLLQFNNDDLMCFGINEVINFWYDWAPDQASLSSLSPAVFSAEEGVALNSFFVFCDREHESLPDEIVYLVGNAIWIELCERAALTVAVFMQRGKVHQIIARKTRSSINPRNILGTFMVTS